MCLPDATPESNAAHMHGLLKTTCRETGGHRPALCVDRPGLTPDLSTLSQRSAASSPDDPAAFVRSLSECREGVVLVDVHTPRWPLLFATDSFRDLTDLRPSPSSTGDAFFWDEFSLLASDGPVCKASACSAGQPAEEALCLLLSASLQWSCTHGLCSVQCEGTIFCVGPNRARRPSAGSPAADAVTRADCICTWTAHGDVLTRHSSLYRRRSRGGSLRSW